MAARVSDGIGKAANPAKNKNHFVPHRTTTDCRRRRFRAAPRIRPMEKAVPRMELAIQSPT